MQLDISTVSINLNDMKKLFFGLILVVSLVSCTKPVVRYPDTCRQRELFQSCRANVYADRLQHQRTEVQTVEGINSCRSVAYHNSLKPLEQIRPECRQ